MSGNTENQISERVASGVRLKIMHASLQFSDRPYQQRHDIIEIFRAGADVITWTEASPDNANYRLVKEIGPKYGYTVHAPGAGVGVAVKKSLGRVVNRGFIKVAPGKAGQYSNRGISWVEIDVPWQRESVFVGAVHYVTKGRTPRDGARYWINRRFAQAIGAFARTRGQGRRLVFVNGDFNILDNKMDVFFGEPLTTCWDELKKWPNTGHGNIDAISSYDGDGRTKCISARAYNDKAWELFTDHFPIEAVYEIAK